MRMPPNWPTEEMLTEGYAAHRRAAKHPRLAMGDALKAMLAAAPTPPPMKDAAVEAIKFAITDDDGCEAQTFLRLWLEGDFNVIRREWPNVPDSVFIGADPHFENLRAALRETK